MILYSFTLLIAIICLIEKVIMTTDSSQLKNTETNSKHFLQSVKWDSIGDGHFKNILVLSLDGTLNYVNSSTGKSHWARKLHDIIHTDQYYQMQYSNYNSDSDFQSSTLIIANPVTGDLYQLNSEKDESGDKWEINQLKKLPFSVTQLVNLSPCRSADGALYIGSKKDSWIVLDELTGKSVKSIVSNPNKKTETCPQFDFQKSTIHVGFTQYTVSKYSPDNLHLIWNITFIDYNSHSILSQLSAFNDMFFTSSEDGRLAAVNVLNGETRWIYESPSPVVSIFIKNEQNYLFNRDIYTVNSASMDYYLKGDFSKIVDSFVRKNIAKRIIYIGRYRSTFFALEVISSFDVDTKLLLPDFSKTGNYYNSVGFYPTVTTIPSMELFKDWKRISQQDVKNSSINVFPDNILVQFLTGNFDIINQPFAIYKDGVVVISFANILILSFSLFIGFFMIRYFYKKMLKREKEPVSGTIILNQEEGLNVSQEILDKDELNVGCLIIYPKKILGRGCNGTVVYEGKFDGRLVAIKRVLPEASFVEREISLLKNSDFHQNVVRYFCTEKSFQFMYIALELCECTLEQYVSDSKFKTHLEKIEAWKQIVNGISHLHCLNVVHRDVKPANILVKNASCKKKKICFLISDFGFCKEINFANVSVSLRSGAVGTVGWTAPEMVDFEKSRKITKAVDIFSLGCILYYILSDGNHPFGSSIERIANIVNQRSDLRKINNILQAIEVDLISSMIQNEPTERPPIHVVILHPMVWDKDKRLGFLLDTSDRLENVNRDNVIMQEMEIKSMAVVYSDWVALLGEELKKDLRNFRTYRTNSVQHLLRAIRNKRHHYMSLTPNIQKSLGSIPDGFYDYFHFRFPLLLIHVYKVMKYVADEPVFQTYYHKWQKKKIMSVSDKFEKLMKEKHKIHQNNDHH